MTPLALRILIQFYTSPTSYPNSEFPAIRSEIYNLVFRGLLASCGSDYVVTDKGRAHVKQLCELPIPFQRLVWVALDGEIIDIENERKSH